MQVKGKQIVAIRSKAVNNFKNVLKRKGNYFILTVNNYGYNLTYKDSALVGTRRNVIYSIYNAR